jgi:hypothetical protein
MKPFGSVNLWEEVKKSTTRKNKQREDEKIWIIELISQLNDFRSSQTCFSYVFMSTNHDNDMMQSIEGSIKGENNKNMCDSRHFFNFFSLAVLPYFACAEFTILALPAFIALFCGIYFAIARFIYYNY